MDSRHAASLLPLPPVGRPRPGPDRRDRRAGPAAGQAACRHGIQADGRGQDQRLPDAGAAARQPAAGAAAAGQGLARTRAGRSGEQGSAGDARQPALRLGRPGRATAFPRRGQPLQLPARHPGQRRAHPAPVPVAAARGPGRRRRRGEGQGLLPRPAPVHGQRPGQLHARRRGRIAPERFLPVRPHLHRLGLGRRCSARPTRRGPMR